MTDVLEAVTTKEEREELKKLMTEFLTLDRVGQLLVLNSASTLSMAQDLRK